MPRLADLALSRAEVDRAAVRRTDEQWLDQAWRSTRSRVLLVDDGRVPVGEDGTSLVWCQPDRVPDGERFLLGVGDGEVAYFAVQGSGVEVSERRAGLREVGGLLSGGDAGLVVHAVALAHWHARHRYCPRCGCRTELSAAGAERRCVVDGSTHFPRTDPAIIVLVTDPDDRALLGRQRWWGPGRFSTLAGFVEPGEDAEHAVVREVAEESGVRLGDVDYLGSQPWPFPASLMLGFRARAVDGRDPVVDGVELAEARWFSRPGLTAALADGSLVLPPRVSIARRLVEDWFGDQLPDAAEAWR